MQQGYFWVEMLVMGATNEILVLRIPNILWLGLRPYVGECMKATKTMAVAPFSYGKEEVSLSNSCYDGTGTAIACVLRTGSMMRLADDGVHAINSVTVLCTDPQFDSIVLGTPPFAY